MSGLEENDAALRAAIEAFSRARGLTVEPIGDDAVLTRGGRGMSGVVHIAANAADPTAAALRAIADLRAAGAAAEEPIPVVKRGRAGINRAQIAAAGGSPLTPAQFFDWYYRARAASETDDKSNVSARLRAKFNRFLSETRAPQPFRRLSALDADAPPLARGRDLFETVAADFAAAPTRPRLIVLCGPAGVGKSVLTAHLLKAAHDAFNAAKNRDALGARPILFEPVELGSTAQGASEIHSFDRLIDRLFGAEIARAVPAPAFAWLNQNGLNSWTLDGLDEFFRRQTDFFELIAQALDAPGGRAQILISTRDSLFASSDALRGFLGRRLQERPDETEIYELEPWDAAAKRAYIAAVLAAEQGSAHPPQINAIAERIEARADLAELSNLPFYCSLLVAAIRRGDEKALASEFALLQFTIDAMIDREAVEKQVIRLHEFVADFDREELAEAVAADGGDDAALEAAVEARGRAELLDMLGLAAFLYLFAEPEPLDAMAAADWIDGVLPTLIGPELDEASAARLELALAHFPLFGRGDAEGDVRFVHRLIAEYLAATYALNLIRFNPGSSRTWEMALGKRRDWRETVFFRRLRAEISQDAPLRRIAEDLLASGAFDKRATLRVGALLE